MWRSTITVENADVSVKTPEVTSAGVLTEILALSCLVDPIEVVDLGLLLTRCAPKPFTARLLHWRSLWTRDGKGAIKGVSAEDLVLTIPEQETIRASIGKLDKCEVVAVGAKNTLVLALLLIFQTRNKIDDGRYGGERTELAKRELITLRRI